MNDIPIIDRIREIENEWVELADGCRLAARIWLPRGAETTPVPGVLEYIPYRKRDLMRRRDETIHRYFAASGYAAVRVDLRGSGDSDGLLLDEYLPQELEDALEVIQWITEQPWCDGNVGMMGISWGGFNALQVAALRPPALKAVITLCSTDDRYTDDVHYMGGCLLNENLQWGSTVMAYGAYPPDPEIVGERWRDMWRRRIEAITPFPAVWMEHQRRDEYWKHGSVCEDYAAIACPVYAISGWADGYSNAVPRLMAGLACPKKGLVGPWAHMFPHDGVPGPAIGFLQEAVRWWDHWLKGHETGIMDEPLYRVWMQDHIPPSPAYDERPGRWVAETAWPSPRIRWSRYFLNAGHLDKVARAKTELAVSSPQTTGSRAGDWCGVGADGEAPLDQRADDGRSLTFETAPLDERLEILGAPEVTLMIAVDQPQAFVSVRLTDIAPGGAATQVTYGLLNLSHRDGHETPAYMEPGRFSPVALKLNDIAYAFPAGHRVGVSVSTSYWPMVWPSPRTVVATVRTGESTLRLPVRPPSPDDAALRPFEEPEWAEGTEHKTLRRQPLRRVIESDLTTGETVYTFSGDAGEIGGAGLARIEAINLDIGYTMMRRYRISETDPASAQAESTQTTMLKRNGWSVRIECRTRLAATATAYQFTADLETFEGDEPFLKREWNLTIPRDHS